MNRHLPPDGAGRAPATPPAAVPAPAAPAPTAPAQAAPPKSAAAAAPGRAVPAQGAGRARAALRLHGADLLDGVPRWGVMDTSVGQFRLQPVRLPRDLALVAGWMNDPDISAFWELAGPRELTEHHIRVQLDGDGRSVPCLGLLDGVPMSYWEVYRADLDPIALHYPSRPHDTGLHLLLGPADSRGRGIGSVLLRAVAERVLRERHDARRVVAEPDIRNIPSMHAFLKAGFRHDRDLPLPGKHAALLIYDRR